MSDRWVWVFLVGCGIVVLIAGILLGIKETNSRFDFNNRDCTIACPGNAESIQYKGECYCKLEK